VTPEHELYLWDGKFKFQQAINLNIGDYLIGNFGKNIWGNANKIHFKWQHPVKHGDQVECPICHKKSTQLSEQHIRSHGLTSSTFRQKFPDHSMRSDTMLSVFNNMKDTHLPRKMTPTLARLLGYFIAEGNNTHKRIDITNTEDDVISDILKCSKDNFDSISVMERIHPNKKWSNVTTITINGRKELALFEYLGCPPRLSYEKQIPTSILYASRDNVIEFLRGYFEGDGHVSKSKNRVFCNSTSEHLIRQLFHVLANLGILSSFHIIPKNESTQYALHINGQFAKKFVEEVGFISERKISIARNLCERVVSDKLNLFGFPVSALIRNINLKNYDKLAEFKKEYGFYGFSNQATQGLSMIEK